MINYNRQTIMGMNVYFAIFLNSFNGYDVNVRRVKNVNAFSEYMY